MQNGAIKAIAPFLDRYKNLRKLKVFDDGFKSCCFTGYRPQKFPFDLVKGNREYTEFENLLTNTVLDLCDRGIVTFYTGMAMGFDIVAAETVLDIRECYGAVRLVAAIPFSGQSSRFDETWKKRYERILRAADETVLLSDTYYKGCFENRNQFMVDNSDVVVTWFDGQKGGTASTLYYAQKNEKEIINLYDRADDVCEYAYFITDADCDE